MAIADGLERLPQLAGRLNAGLDDRHPDWLQALCTPDPALAELAQAVRHALIDTPPLSLSEGGLIHDGVDPLLDGLRNELSEGLAQAILDCDEANEAEIHEQRERVAQLRRDSANCANMMWSFSPPAGCSSRPRISVMP